MKAEHEDSINVEYICPCNNMAFVISKTIILLHSVCLYKCFLESSVMYAYPVWAKITRFTVRHYKAYPTPRRVVKLETEDSVVASLYVCLKLIDKKPSGI